MRLCLRGSHVRRKFRKRSTLRSESSTLKGLLYAPIKREQYLNRTTQRRLKIPPRSFRGKECRTFALERSVSEKAVIRQATINLFFFFTSWKFLWDSILGLYRVAWLTQESVSSRIFVRKIGMSHVPFNGRA
jgi:hypothetical protein